MAGGVHLPEHGHTSSARGQAPHEGSGRGHSANSKGPFGARMDGGMAACCVWIIAGLLDVAAAGLSFVRRRAAPLAPPSSLLPTRAVVLGRGNHTSCAAPFFDGRRSCQGRLGCTACRPPLHFTCGNDRNPDGPRPLAGSAARARGRAWPDRREGAAYTWTFHKKPLAGMCLTWVDGCSCSCSCSVSGARTDTTPRKRTTWAICASSRLPASQCRFRNRYRTSANCLLSRILARANLLSRCRAEAEQQPRHYSTQNHVVLRIQK